MPPPGSPWVLGRGRQPGGWSLHANCTSADVVQKPRVDAGYGSGFGGAQLTGLQRHVGPLGKQDRCPVEQGMTGYVPYPDA